MTFASIFNFQKHTSPKAATNLLTQDWMSAQVYCIFGCDERGVIGRSSEGSDDLYLTNLPAC